VRLATLVLVPLLAGALPAAAQKAAPKSKGPKVYVITPDGHGVEEKQFLKQQEQAARAARAKQTSRTSRRSTSARAAPRPPAPAPAASGVKEIPAPVSADIRFVPAPAKRQRP
jgi:hypothetical protein